MGRFAHEDGARSMEKTAQYDKHANIRFLVKYRRELKWRRHAISALSWPNRPIQGWRIGPWAQGSGLGPRPMTIFQMRDISHAGEPGLRTLFSCRTVIVARYRSAISFPIKTYST